MSGRPRFSEAAFLAFMDENHLDCMIRGHSKWEEGVQIIL